MDTILKEKLRSAMSPQGPDYYPCRKLTSLSGLMLMVSSKHRLSGWTLQHVQEFMQLHDAIAVLLVLSRFVAPLLYTSKSTVR